MNTDDFTSAANTIATQRSPHDPEGYTTSEARGSSVQEPTRGGREPWQRNQAMSNASLSSTQCPSPLNEPPKVGEWVPASIERCREAIMTARQKRYRD